MVHCHTIRGSARGAFTLVELIVSIGVGVMTIGGIMALFFLTTNNGTPTYYSYTSNYGTNTYELVPSAVQFTRAAKIVPMMQSAMDGASAVFVLGGMRSSPTANATSGALAPLTAGCLPISVVNLSVNNIPTDSFSFRSLLAGQTGVNFETSFSPSDFTVLTISGINRVSSVTQVRRYTDTSGMVYYEVVFDTALGTVRDSVDGSASQNRFCYRMALTAAEDANWSIPPSALHYWYRFDSLWNRFEEAPARIVLPDPFLLGGAQATTETAPFSRFIFFASVIL